MKQYLKIKNSMPISQQSLKSDNSQLLYRAKLSLNNIKQGGQDSYSLPSKSFQTTLNNLMQRQKRKQFLPSHLKGQNSKQQIKFQFNTPKNYKRYSHVKDHNKHNIQSIKPKLQSCMPIFIQNQNTLGYFNNHVNNIKSQNLKGSSEKIMYRDSLIYHSPQSVKSNKIYDSSHIKHRIAKYFSQEIDTNGNKNTKSLSKDIFDLPKNRHKKGIRNYLNKKHSKAVNMRRQVLLSKQASFQQIYKQQIQRKLSPKKQQKQTSCNWLKNRKSFSIKQMKLKRKGCNPYSVVFPSDNQLKKNLQQSSYFKVMYFKSKKLLGDTLDQNADLAINNSKQYTKQDQLLSQIKTEGIVCKNKGSTFYLNYSSTADDSSNLNNLSWIQRRRFMGNSRFKNETIDGNCIQPWQKQVQDQDHLLANHNDKHIFNRSNITIHQTKKNNQDHF